MHESEEEIKESRTVWCGFLAIIFAIKFLYFSAVFCYCLHAQNKPHGKAKAAKRLKIKHFCGFSFWCPVGDSNPGHPA